MSNRSRGRLIVISGPSGAGKTTLCRMLLEKHPELVYSVSATTRRPRGREMEEVDYRFLINKEFRRGIAEGEFAEWAEVHGNLYGTPRNFLEDNLHRGRKVILDIDVQGARQIRENYPEALLLFILPPSLEVLKIRLKERMTEGGKEIEKRISKAEEELKEAESFDYSVVNQDLHKTLSEMEEIVEKETRRC